jgi:hypothetical protein
VHRLLKALHLGGAEIAALEEIADDDLPGANADTNPQRLGRLELPIASTRARAAPFDG